MQLSYNRVTENIKKIFYEGLLRMLKTKTKFLRLALGGILCGSLILHQPALIFASEESAASVTPVPDPHTEYYTQAAKSDSIEGWPAGPSVEAQSAIVLDLSTNTVLYSKNPNTELYPASITKIMTALLGCENLDFGSTITISESAAYGIEAGSSSIYGDAGEEFTPEQVLMGLMLESANEMALAISEEVSGSTKKFVELMNERARQLGCGHTHFNNPHGLPDETHYTSAYDMAKIARAAWFNPLFRKFVTTNYFEIPPTNKFTETRYLLNHHEMMPTHKYAYDGVLGGKTGYTTKAGSTLVTYALRDDMALVVVVMNTLSGGWSDTAALLDYGFGNFQHAAVPVEKEPVPVKTLPSEKYILNNCGNTFPFFYQTGVTVTVPNGTDLSGLTTKQTFLNNKAGPSRLRINYYYNDQRVGISYLYERNILSSLLQ